MPAKKILIGIDFSADTLAELKFVLDSFDNPKNQLVLLYHEQKGNSNFSEFQKAIKSCKNVKAAFENHFNLDEPVKAGVSIQPIQKNIKDQCKFADLFICTKNAYEREFKDLFNKEMMNEQNLCCPRILLPENYSQVDNVALIYDGAATSLYAIKQFCRIMPEVCRDKEIVLLIFSGNDYSTDKEQEDKLFVGYLQQHCKQLAVHYYSGEDEIQLRKMLNIGVDTLLITGESSVPYFDRIFSHNETIQIIDIY